MQSDIVILMRFAVAFFCVFRLQLIGPIGGAPYRAARMGAAQSRQPRRLKPMNIRQNQLLVFPFNLVTVYGAHGDQFARTKRHVSGENYVVNIRSLDCFLDVYDHSRGYRHDGFTQNSGLANSALIQLHGPVAYAFKGVALRQR